MATTQRVELLAVLALIFAVLSISAAGALGLITFQVPATLSGIWSIAGEISVVARWALVAYVAIHMLIHHLNDAE